MRGVHWQDRQGVAGGRHTAPDLHLTVNRVAQVRARCVHACHSPTAAQVEQMIARAYQVVSALAELEESHGVEPCPTLFTGLPVA